MDKVIIHISDLHVTDHTEKLGKVCDHSCLSTNPDKKDDCNAFITKIARKINEKFETKEKYLLITGDIANISEQSEYELAENLINSLSKNLNITDNSRIIIIPGDHDWCDRLVKNAFASNQDKQLNFDINSIKYQNFNDHFYKKIKGKDFDNKKIIFDITEIGDKILLLSLNSTLKIQKLGDLGDIDISLLQKELDSIIEKQGNKQLLVAFHHNISGNYENKKTGGFNEKTWGKLLGLLGEKKVKCIFCGNEHTHASFIIETSQIFTSEAGSVSSIKDTIATFKCYEIKEDKNKIVLNNHFALLDKNNSLEATGYGNWIITDVKNNQNENEKIDLFEILNNEDIIGTIVQKLPELPAAEDKKEEREIQPIKIIPSQYKYGNKEYIDILYKIIKEKKLFHTGHFHWSDISHVLNWIDTLKLIENKDDLLFIKNAIIDVMQGIQNHYKELNNSDLTYDLITGLGYQGTMIATKAALQFNIPFSSLPYSYRELDHNPFERELNIDIEKKYKCVVIVTDVVHSGATISKLINEQQKNFFDNVENIFVISVIYTGKEEFVEQVTFDSDRVHFSYILNLEVTECSNKGKSKCRIEEDKLSDVLYFYTKKTGVK